MFRDACLSHVDLTGVEREKWPDELDCVLREEGMWAAEDRSEWDVPRQRAFLVDLLGTSRDAFPLE